MKEHIFGSIRTRFWHSRKAKKQHILQEIPKGQTLRRKYTSYKRTTKNLRLGQKGGIYKDQFLLSTPAQKRRN